MSHTIFVGGAAEGDVASKIDALRCDHVKAALYPERQRIASRLLKLAMEDPELKNVDKEELAALYLDAMFYFGDEVYKALKRLQQHTVPHTGGDKVAHLQEVLLDYFDLRTLK